MVALFKYGGWGGRMQWWLRWLVLSAVVASIGGTANVVVILM